MDSRPPALHVRDLSLWYGNFQALDKVNLDVPSGAVTGMIGPSGCGKSTLLRCVTRIVERAGTVYSQGTLEVMGHDVYAKDVELVQLRKHVGMVFQRPNPLPLSVRENILFGQKVHGVSASRAEQDEQVHAALTTVLLWDAVKDRLGAPATTLSLEQQQKLCIARLLPVKPSILLMDEPCSALDAEGTAAVEELIWRMRGDYTILVVTHNMAQARRATEHCIFMLDGKVVEHCATRQMFEAPSHAQTADYIAGRFG